MLTRIVETGFGGHGDISLPSEPWGYVACFDGWPEISLDITVQLKQYCVSVPSGDALVGFHFGRGAGLRGPTSLQHDGTRVAFDDGGVEQADLRLGSWPVAATAGVDSFPMRVSLGAPGWTTEYSSVSYAVAPETVAPGFISADIEIHQTTNAGHLGEIETSYDLAVEIGDTKYAVQEGYKLLISPQAVA